MRKVTTTISITPNRACPFEVSVEQPQRDAPFLAESLNPLLYKHLYTFSRNR